MSSVQDDDDVVDTQQALKTVLDDTAHAAEQALADGDPLGIWLVPLDDHLEPQDVARLPAHMVPPTPGERRWWMECLVPSPAGLSRGLHRCRRGLQHVWE